MLVIHAEILPEHLTPVNFDADEPYEQMFKVLQSSDASDSVRDMVNYIADGVLVLDESQKQKLIWSRKIITAFYKQHRNSIESGDFSFMRKESFPQSLKIFCGHNVVPFPMKVGQQYYIDTGAALGYNPQNTANLFSQFGHEFFALSMVDMTSGHSYGCITSAERRHEIVRLERSIYHYEALRF